MTGSYGSDAWLSSNDEIDKCIYLRIWTIFNKTECHKYHRCDFRSAKLECQWKFIRPSSFSHCQKKRRNEQKCRPILWLTVIRIFGNSRFRGLIGPTHRETKRCQRSEFRNTIHISVFSFQCSVSSQSATAVPNSFSSFSVSPCLRERSFFDRTIQLTRSPTPFAGRQNQFGFRILGSATEVSEGKEVRIHKHDSNIFSSVISVASVAKTFAWRTRGTKTRWSDHNPKPKLPPHSLLSPWLRGSVRDHFFDPTRHLRSRDIKIFSVSQRACAPSFDGLQK